MKTPVFVLIALMAMPALASERKQSMMEKMQARKAFVTQFAAEPKASVSFLRQYDFEPLGQHSLLLYESMSRAYLVEIEDFCTDLPWVMAIGIDTKTSNLNAKFDSIRVRDRSCRILEIRPVDVKAMKAEQKRLNAAKKAAKQGGP